MMKRLLSIFVGAFAFTMYMSGESFAEVSTFADDNLPAPQSFDATTFKMSSPVEYSKSTRKIESVYDVCGDFLMWFEPKTTGTVAKYSGVTIKMATLQTVTIEGFWSTQSKPITATVDYDNSKLIIKPQVIIDDATYGECDIATWANKWYGLAIYRDKNLEIAVDGDKLTFLTNWGIFINKGKNADKYFEMSENTTLTRANGKMEMQTKTAVAPTTTVVNIEQQDRDINITNFGGFGKTVTAKAYNDDTVYIPQQVVYSYYNGTEVVDYSSWLVDLDKNSLTGKIINNGKMTKDELRIGPWGIFYPNDSGSYTGIMYQYGVITFTNGQEFNCMLGVDTTEMIKEVKDVKYVNLQGIESSRPFYGMNIKITTYSDGSKKITKLIAK